MRQQENLSPVMQNLLHQALHYHHHGQLDKAKTLYQQILAQEKNSIALHYLGIIEHFQNNDVLAIKLIKESLQLKPNYSEAYNNLGEIYRKQNNFSKAIEFYQKALKINPNYADSYYNFANVLLAQNKLDEAINYYQKVIALNPLYTESYYNLGNALLAKDQFNEAITHYQQAIKLNPSHANAYNNLASTLIKQHKIKQAITYYEKAIALNPDYAEAYYNLGVAFTQNNQLALAVACYRQVLYIEPNYNAAQWNLALVQLRQGNYEQGFLNYECRWYYLHEHLTLKKLFPLIDKWQQTLLSAKTVLIVFEQGYGDAIQFIRYVNFFDKKTRIILYCPPILTKLFTRIIPAELIFNAINQLPAFDSVIALMSLPQVFNTQLVSIPAPVPYLNAQQYTGKLLVLNKQKLNIGFIWVGSENKKDDNRPVPLHYFAPLIDIANTQFYSLQICPKAQQLIELGLDKKVIDCKAMINDFADTAMIIEQLDLVISIDSAVAHLAGALAKPVWIVLPFCADWRWLINRDDCPWYPTARLFRQPAVNDWQSVFNRVKYELINEVNKKLIVLLDNNKK